MADERGQQGRKKRPHSRRTGGETERETNAVTLLTMTKERSSRLGREDESLLPGLPHEVIWNQIVPKISWRAFHALASVSRAWRQAIESRQVYDERVRSHSTETLVVYSHVDGNDEVISLYSVRDDSWYQLPLFPQSRKIRRQVPGACQCIALEGKIYVLGAEKKLYGGYYTESDSDVEDYYDSTGSLVYVLDLVGHGKWKQCASMPQQIYGFACGVFAGKIYVFGGKNCAGGEKRGCLVYDPKENTWSSISAMKYKQSDFEAIAVGEELYMHGAPHCIAPGADLLAEVYHPGKDEWRLLVPFGIHVSERLFMAHGKLHSLSPLGIHVHDIDSGGNSFWTLLQSTSSFLDRSKEVYAVQYVNEELLALVTSLSYGERGGETRLYRSKGFGSKNKEIVWERVPSDVLKYPKNFRAFPHFMCCIQL